MFVASQLNAPPREGQIERTRRMRHLATLAIVTAACALFAGQANAATILVSDAENGRVLEFGTDGTFLGTFASGFGRPAGIQLGPDGNVYIADAVDDGEIRKFQTDGTELAAAFDGLADVKPDDIAFNSSGQLFFVNPFGTAADGVYRVDSTTTATEVLDATNFDNPPRGLTFDDSDNMLVADRSSTDGSGELESFDTSFNSNGTIITDEPLIQAPLYHNGSVFYTFRLAIDSNDPAAPGSGFVVREIDPSDGSILNTYDAPTELDGAGTLLDTIVLSDGDLLVAAFAADAVLRLDPDTGTFTDFASGTFDSTQMDGPSFMAVIPEPASLALLGLGGGVMLAGRRR